MNLLFYVIASKSFFILLTKVIIPKTCSQYLKHEKLSENQKSEFALRMSSNFHAILVSCICLYLILFDETIRTDPVWGYSELVATNLTITVGFLLADLLVMSSSFEAAGGSWTLCFHHVGSIYAYSLAIRNGVLLYFANFRLLAEISTPFVNARWCLATLNMKDNKLYFINGVLMAAVFFLCRIAIMPFFYYMAWQVISTESYQRVSFPIHVSWLGICLMLDVFNCIWFDKMVRGALKHLNYVKGRSTSMSLVTNGRDVHCNRNGEQAKGLNGAFQHSGIKSE
ncbi:unnamed protein product [Clavelina lepadiformis]|uniref:TLC domain-containing protein n=2 Tax=Clavelina lepadiformis TaxID=159417 RepID=A0ABP0GDV0_CLALP